MVRIERNSDGYIFGNHSLHGYFSPRIGTSSDEWHHLNGIKNIVDAMGLVWFVVGNMWLFADDDAQGCEHPDRSPVYRLCAIMLSSTHTDLLAASLHLR